MIFWIASYPKSGNTWVRALISTYYYSQDGIFSGDLIKKIGQFPEKVHFDGFDYNRKIVTDTTRFWIQAQERINVGDDKHKLENITKVVSGSNDKTTKKVYHLYKKIIKAKIFKASSIKVAEAAKVIENTQRDLNIAFLNELSIIFDKLDISTSDVLEAASTKWNFIKFKPGLVGGHCIGVDPFYLAHVAKKTGYLPKVILAGREINEKMSRFVFNKTLRLMKKKKLNINKSKILILGYSFKENCSDPRNSKVQDIVKHFLNKKISIKIYDPVVYKEFLEKKYKDLFINKISNFKNYFDGIILAVPHKIFLNNYRNVYKKILKKNHIIFDVKSVLKKGFSTTTL